ncbi:ABC transporter, ATP-binding protein, partial [mine drainage metagenome]
RGVPRGEQPRRIRNVLEEVKMLDWAHQKVGRFSKGMKQRIQIAAALVHDPEVLILDEPSTGLDPRGMAEVRAIVREQRKHGRLIFMSSHILSEVTDVCDEVALIDRGKLLFYDTLANVTARFSTGSAQVDAVFVRPLDPAQVTGTIAHLPGVKEVELLDPKRVRLGSPRGRLEQAQVLEALVALRLGLVSFKESTGALEDIYMQQIARGD